MPLITLLRMIINNDLKRLYTFKNTFFIDFNTFKA